jgi:glyoxylase I family protein
MTIFTQGMAPLFQVFDMPASLAFYRDMLGFEVQNPTDDDVGWVLLKLNDAELMLNTAYEKDDRPIQPDPVRKTAHADTSIYFGCSDVDGTYEELRARGLDIAEPMETGYGFKAITLIDPDGYLLVFHWPLSKEAD